MPRSDLQWRNPPIGAAKAGAPHRNLAIVLADGLVHTGEAVALAIAARPRLVVARTPHNALERDDGGRSRRDLERRRLALQPFEDAAHLDIAVHEAVHRVSAESRTGHPCGRLRIAARRLCASNPRCRLRHPGDARERRALVRLKLKLY